MDSTVKRLIELGASHSVSKSGVKRVYVPANLYSLSEKDLYEAVALIYFMGMKASNGEVTPLYRDSQVRGWIYERP